MQDGVYRKYTVRYMLAGTTRGFTDHRKGNNCPLRLPRPLLVVPNPRHSC